MHLLCALLGFSSCSLQLLPFRTAAPDALVTRESGWVCTLHERANLMTDLKCRRRQCKPDVAIGMSVDGDASCDSAKNNDFLLRVDFKGVQTEPLRLWIRRYPFGAALPVQPFSLNETEEGVDVIFRKKPTLERSSEDGGLQLTVADVAGAREEEGRSSTLIVRRISRGQEIRKIFAERVAVKALVKSLREWLPASNICSILHEEMLK
ncbi:unnamed protein product [Choristocarpus tenellus]